jgi:hypothetical protein
MKPNFSKQTIVVASPSQVASALGTEIAILNLKTEVYFGLNTVGAWVWSQIQEPKSVDAICEAFLARYDVEPATGERDLLELLDQMATEGLIEVSEPPQLPHP